MAMDPMFMDFGLNLVNSYVEGRKTDVVNQGIALNNEIADIMAAEQQGYAAVNYRQSLEELQNASLEVAVQERAAAAEARLNSAVYGVSEEAQVLDIARAAGKSQAEIEQGKKFDEVNFKQARKAIQAQKVSAQKVGINKPTTMTNVVNAGASTYFRALKAGLIS